jgi:putative oxidoreductase
MRTFLSTRTMGFHTGLALVRIITGSFLAYHGWEIFDAAKMKEYQGWDAFNNASSGAILVYLGKGAELVSGILLIAGLLTRIACLIIIGTMGYIAFFLGNGIIWYNDQHPFLFVLMAMLFIFTGPGKYSIDHLLFDKSSY